MQVLTAQQYAQRLMTSSYSDGVTRAMRPGSDGTITVNLTDLTGQETWLARAALSELGTVTGLRFSETSGAAKITYSNDGSGANTRTTASGTTINSATVRIGSDRVSAADGYGSFAFRTYMHETLHALGLGHPQDYGRVREFSQSAIANDSWQISLMSYFDQDENTWLNATKAYQLTPMLADYLALQQMYGPTAIHSGNTIYGVNSNAGGSLNAAAGLGARATFLVADKSGIDHVNFSGSSATQTINLTPGAISSVMGAVGNMQIAPDTQIENATGGSGADTIIGNGAANRLAGNGGNDHIRAGAGADTALGGEGNDFIDGGTENDTIWAGAGSDTVDGGIGADLIGGGTGNDTVNGGAGNDTIWGGLDADRLSGSDGNDMIGGGAGNDVINGGNGHDTIFGASETDNINAGEGNDLVFGGDGNDTISGGGGNDIIWGGAGADQFIFDSGSDTIRGFDEAEDLIDLRSFAELDTWADVQGKLVQIGSHVEFRQNGHTLLIEGTKLADLEADNFLW